MGIQEFTGERLAEEKREEDKKHTDQRTDRPENPEYPTPPGAECRNDSDDEKSKQVRKLSLIHI